MEEPWKRSRIRMLLPALFHEQGVEATPVNDYQAQMSQKGRSIYYKDKKEWISMRTKCYGCLMNVISNHPMSHLLTAPAGSAPYRRADHLLYSATALFVRSETLFILIQRNIGIWCLPISTHADFLKFAETGTETEKKALNRFLMMMEIIGFVCYNAIFFEYDP
ncbi:MAG: TetR/AcrR family transcriptional regulator [[Clostridium] innocuum]